VAGVAMTGRLLALLAANVLMLALGTGLLPLLGLARTRRELLAKLPLGYLVGIVATGVLAAELAVVDVAAGRVVLAVAAVAVLAAGLYRTSPSPAPERERRTRSDLAALAVLAATIALLVRAAPLFAVKPLLESDGWMIWGLRARALLDFGHPSSPVFTSLAYPALQHPLWLPALEALDFRFIGSFDGTLIHLQLLALAAAFVGGAWVLLRRHVSSLLLAATLLAIVTAPAFLAQLQTNFADMPLAMLMGLGVAALGVWLTDGVTDGTGLLAAAALFLGAAATTKNEGELFALAAYVSAAVVARRSQLRPLAWAALATLLIDLPWRLWLQVEHAKIAEYSLADAFNPAYLRRADFRVGPAAHELARQIAHVSNWSYVVAFGVVGLVGALAAGRFRPAAFGLVWLALSFLGLVVVYWISTNPLADHLDFSSDRTIDSLVVGAAMLVPVLLRPEPEPARIEAPATPGARVTERVHGWT
jgi:hypothetical protein